MRTFAHAGLTGPGGHPGPLYEDVLRVDRYEPALGPLERGWFENRAYIVIETEADIEEKWALITSGQPDFVKVYLVHSEDDGASEGLADLSDGTGSILPWCPALSPRLTRQGYRSRPMSKRRLIFAGRFARASMRSPTCRDGS